MKIAGHKTNSMYRRYLIVDEDELGQAQEQQQAFLKNQTAARNVSRSEPGLESMLIRTVSGTVKGFLGLKMSLELSPDMQVVACRGGRSRTRTCDLSHVRRAL
jgi:hypothetical protein